MKSMFYFMNVDIAWIKQRPHYIAENLANNYDVTIYYPYFFNRKVLSRRSISNTIKTKRIYRVPNAIHSKIFRSVIEWINGIIIKTEIKIKKPDILFLCSPDSEKFIPLKYNGQIVYDCMDDLVALANTSENRERVHLLEGKLVKRADTIFVSSNELINVLNNRYGLCEKNKMYLCKNAFNGKVSNNTSAIKTHEGIFRIGYFGTISSWFDFDILKQSLEINRNIEYILAGPIVEGVKIPKNKRLTYVGILEHDELESFVQDLDCFIMPFVVNDIIKSVDPVKFYEYINFNKNIISVYYDEIKRFDNFVYFYDDEKTFNKVLENVVHGKVKYNEKERVEFLNNNSWISRCNDISKVL